MDQGVPLEIQQEQRAACERPQGDDHLDYLVVPEVMQNRRAEHKAEGFSPKGKPQGICNNSGRGRVTKMSRAVVE